MRASGPAGVAGDGGRERGVRQPGGHRGPRAQAAGGDEGGELHGAHGGGARVREPQLRALDPELHPGGEG